MGDDKVNPIFDLPNTQQSLLYHHVVAGFPPKNTYLDAVRAGNYAMWPGLMTTLILKHFPDLDKMQKGLMKGQWKGVLLTKVTAPVSIKVEPGTVNPPLPTIKKHYDIFVMVYKLLDTVHTDQTGTFLITLQQGYLVHHGGHPSGCKLYHLQINEEQNQGQDDHGLPKNG
jgi:hypothetical protein